MRYALRLLRVFRVLKLTAYAQEYQAPNQRSWYRPLFRNLVYAALND